MNISDFFDLPEGAIVLGTFPTHDKGWVLHPALVISAAKSGRAPTLLLGSSQPPFTGAGVFALQEEADLLHAGLHKSTRFDFSRALVFRATQEMARGARRLGQVRHDRMAEFQACRSAGAAEILRRRSQSQGRSWRAA
jgi:hypothetical protein